MRAPSVLDGFFSPESPFDIVFAARALRSLSSGEVTSDELFRFVGNPGPGGILCAQIFGPLQKGRCHCGYLARRPDHQGACTYCHVERVDPAVRNVRFGHIELGVGLLHPGLVPLLCRAIGASADQLRDVLALRAGVLDGKIVALSDYNQETQLGVRSLRSLLERSDDPELRAAGVAPTELLVDGVPVVPPGDRPLVAFAGPAGDRFFPMFAGMRPGADNETYRNLLRRAQYVRRLLAAGAAQYIIEKNIEILQAELDRLCEIYATPIGSPARTVAPESLWVERDPDEEAPTYVRRGFIRLPSRSPGRYTPSRHRPRRQRPLGCAWLDANHVLVQFTDTVVIIDLLAGRIARRVPPTQCRLLGIVERYAVFLRSGLAFDDGRGHLRGLAILDLESGTWINHVPSAIRVVVLANNEPEDGWLEELGSGRSAPIEQDGSGDRPHEIARTPDGRFIWVSSCPSDGCVHALETAQCWLKLSVMKLFDQEVPMVARNAPRPIEKLKEDQHAVAIARRGSRWRILDGEGGVSDDGKRLFRLDRPPLAASFDLAGERLVVVDRDSLAVIALEPPSVLCEHALPELLAS